MAKLVVRAGANPGREFGLPEEGGEVKIGRLPDLPIPVLDTKVSREHCKVYRQSTGWIVEDLQSRNGTFVNGQRVKKRLLQPKDRLKVGQTEFEYSAAAAAEAPASPAASPGVAPPPPTGVAPPPPRSPGFPNLKPTKKPPV